jgi:hypothetical protein
MDMIVYRPVTTTDLTDLRKQVITYITFSDLLQTVNYSRVITGMVATVVTKKQLQYV